MQGMLYTEYATAAITHYRSCNAIYEQCIESSRLKDGCSNDVLYRIYYLCGHVVECAAIYLIYSHHRWDFNPSVQDWYKDPEHIHNIKRYNKRFTTDSHMDFYPMAIQNNRLISKNRKNSKSQPIDFGIVPADLSLDNYCNVQGHDFQKYVKEIIRGKIPSNAPYFRDPKADSKFCQAFTLLDAWSTDLRYYYEGRESDFIPKNRIGYTSLPDINPITIKQLLKVCGKIVTELHAGRKQIL